MKTLWMRARQDGRSEIADLKSLYAVATSVFIPPTLQPVPHSDGTPSFLHPRLQSRPVRVLSSLLIHVDFSQQSLSVRDVALPPVGPVHLQPLLLSLGVLEHPLPPQALPAQLVHAPLCRSTALASSRRERGVRFLGPPFAPASVRLAGTSELGQQDLGLMGRRRRDQQGLGMRWHNVRFLCGEATRMFRHLQPTESNSWMN